jgi:hypothetical protein
MAIVTKDRYTLDEFESELMASALMVDELPIARDLQDQITDLIYAGVQRNFDEQVDSSGQKWPPHAPYTVRLYGPHPLLILTGTMWVASTMSGVEGNYLDVQDRSIVTGVTLPYAAKQQFGTALIPQREFYYIRESYIVEIENLAANYLIQQVIG